MMSNKLVAYFSATGKTAKVAEKLAVAIGADIYDIKPEVKYTKAGLNWMNKKSRSSMEMNDKSIRPVIISGDVDVSGYDTIYLGFPIWWYVAPTLINTFLEAYDFTGKKIVLFATSGSSGLATPWRSCNLLHPARRSWKQRCSAGSLPMRRSAH